MASALALIQFYPAVGKLISDLYGYLHGSTSEVSTNQKLDELLSLLRVEPFEVIKETREVSTQTNLIFYSPK